MTRISHLIGNWLDMKMGKTFKVRKAIDRSNTFLSIEFSTETIYADPFGISSSFIFEDQWHRFDPSGFERLIQEFDLQKMEIAA
jgi:hypothetical protein